MPRRAGSRKVLQSYRNTNTHEDQTSLQVKSQTSDLTVAMVGDLRSQGRYPSAGMSKEEWGACCTKNNRRPSKRQHPTFQRNGRTTHQNCSDEEQNVRQRRTRPIKSPEHHDGEQHTTHGSQSIPIPPPQSSGHIPTTTMSNSDKIEM